jgi:predicted Rossmann fold flavoprotein
LEFYDTVIVGAGAAGLFCAGVAGQLGLKVLVLDHSTRVAEKIRISGGGRCNFTNTGTSAENFLSQNPRFCRSALSRYTAKDFIDLVRGHGIAFHEKHKGQLFCDHSSQDIIDLLLAQCQTGGVTRWQPCRVLCVRAVDSDQESSPVRYEIDCDRGCVRCAALVVATGGLSIAKTGATGWGYDIARQFGLPVVTPRPALVGLQFAPAQWEALAALAGVSLAVRISTGSGKAAPAFQDDLLFTHRGLSGPAALQISGYWESGAPIQINLLPELDVQSELLLAKARSRRLLVNELAQWLPARLADFWVARGHGAPLHWDRPVATITDKALQTLAGQLGRWSITPDGTEGFGKAEVTAGGVDTRALSSQTMEFGQSGLYFIGEVVDVTGWLGGYNFQWAWSSGFACAQAMSVRLGGKH